MAAECQAEKDVAKRSETGTWVGVFFVTRAPKDLSSEVRGRLGSRVQHTLRNVAPTAGRPRGPRCGASPIRRTTWSSASVLVPRSVGGTAHRARDGGRVHRPLRRVPRRRSPRFGCGPRSPCRARPGRRSWTVRSPRRRSTRVVHRLWTGSRRTRG
ncbi:helicase HerA-like domain-containing protein [Streptomyces sp. ALI-76-A]|uniref:helicase HerA-like domain-containing protein n=1 Tax=Streptomyces sp. ALI-76-A TaxID=3025736 RepID=UPI00256EB950|nr:helicase HerA-like domain-containing protein [Streptomyces sp. ALI-76-A]MDL5202512.1 DUF853 family protein [Streptomyces sp. ALI-76-A]